MNRPTRTDIGTYGGGFFDVFNPRPEDLSMEAIAHALSLTCRWGGHCKEFYSVAQHSVLVADYLPKELALQGLLHDAAEAYMGDVPRPIKHSIPAFREQEDKVLRVIWDKYGLANKEMDSKVHEIDNVMLCWEAHNLLHEHDWCENPLPDTEFVAWSPSTAKHMFLITYGELVDESIDRRRYSSL